MTITYALIQMSEKVAEKTDLARSITKAETGKNACVGCIYEKGGQNFQAILTVISASGVFGTDFAQKSLLAKCRPDLLHLPTTNGEHCTGDGVQRVKEIGAKTINLEWAQVHPTGLVKLKDADAEIKFLATEARARHALSSSTQATTEIDSLFEGIDYGCSPFCARFEDLCMDYFRNSMGPVEECRKDSCIEKKNVHDVVLMGGSTRIPKVRTMIHEFLNRNPDDAVLPF